MPSKKPSIGEISLAFLNRGGKKLRPRLCRATFECCGGMGNIEQLAEAIECFHKASLIHDDIQDGDEIRYGQPTTWKEYGVAVAVAAGDWLVSRGYRLILDSKFETAHAIMDAVVASHGRMCEGQGDELLKMLENCNPADDSFDVDNYLFIVERKTGEPFALAAAMGAMAAGADPEPFRKYAMAYGVLFQINDDLADKRYDFDPNAIAKLKALKEEYEQKTAIYRDECSIGVW